MLIKIKTKTKKLYWQQNKNAMLKQLQENDHITNRQISR